MLLSMFLLVVLFANSTFANIIFVEQPTSLNASNNTNMTFHCAASKANLYFWYLNNTLSKYNEDVHSDTEMTENGGIFRSTLKIHTPYIAEILDYTFIHCRALILSEGNPTSVYNTSEEVLLLIQGKLDAPEIIAVDINSLSKSVDISWARPDKLNGIIISGYMLCNCNEQECNKISNTTLSGTANFPNANVSNCEIVGICLAAVTAGEWGHDATVNITFTRGPNFLGDDQIQSEVMYSADSQTFQILFWILFSEKDAHHLPQTYNITISYININTTVEFVATPLEFPTGNGSLRQTLLVNVPGQETSVYSNLEPRNCKGSNLSMPINNELFHLQSVDFSNNYITCNFANGSNAQGCETVLTCNASADGKAQISKSSCVIRKTDPSHSYATGNFACSQSGDCLTYDISVYDIFFDGTMGNNAAKTLHNFTFVSKSLPPTHSILTPSSTHWVPPSPSSTSIHPWYTYVIAALSLILTVTVIISFFIICCLCTYWKKKERRINVGEYPITKEGKQTMDDIQLTDIEHFNNDEKPFGHSY